MRKKLLATAAATAVALGGLTYGITTNASANDGYLCMTKENAPFYDNFNFRDGGTNYLFTLSPNRGFRASGGAGPDDYGRYWISGHGAEHPNREGWVLRSHTTC